MTPRNPEAIKRLAELVRELASRDDYKPLMHYSHLIATLQSFHDEMAATKGTPAHGAIQSAAIKVFKAARTYASEHAFDHPNVVMKACNYNYFNQV
jgi:hypothetical protein